MQRSSWKKVLSFDKMQKYSLPNYEPAYYAFYSHHNNIARLIWHQWCFSLYYSRYFLLTTQKLISFHWRRDRSEWFYLIFLIFSSIFEGYSQDIQDRLNFIEIFSSLLEILLQSCEINIVFNAFSIAFIFSVFSI